MPKLFPYTNTHELNLDWILQVVKDFQSKYTNFDQTIEDALEAIEAAKTGSLEDMQTALTNALEAISDDQTSAQAAIAADQSAALLALQSALTAALSSITTEQTNATRIIEQLYNTLPASAQDILGRLRVLDTIITGYTPSNSFQWLQGSYIYPEGVTPPTPPAINSTSETFNKYVSSRYMEGVAGQRIRITTDGTVLIDVINIWTSNPPGGAPSQYITGELEVTDTYADVILPLNVTAFSIQFAGINEETDISPNDIPGHIDVRWVTDFVGQATIAPKETSNTANIPRKTGELFFLDGVLYKALDDIAVGDTIVTSGAGANCEETTVDEELQEKEDAITDLNSAFIATINPQTWNPSLKKGEYIKGADGTTDTSNRYARTDSLWYGYKSKVAINLASADYEYYISYYDHTGSLDGTGYIGYTGYYKGMAYIPAHAEMFGITFRRTDHANLSDYDITAISVALSAYSSTDTKLTQQGIAADAKSTGDVLASIKDDIYTFIKDEKAHTVSHGNGIDWTTGANRNLNNKYMVTGRIYNKGSKGTIIRAKEGYDFRCAYYSSDSGTYEDTFAGSNENYVTVLTISPDIKYFRIVVHNPLNSISDKTLFDTVDIDFVELAFDVSENSSIKILGIGNSYTWYVFKYLCKIIQNAGAKSVIVGQNYKGGVTLAEQYENRESTLYYDYYRKYSNNGLNHTDTAGKSLTEVLRDEPWDFVIFQQQSDESGQYTSFDGEAFDINDFISYVKTNVSNENVKIGIVAPWSHATGYTGTKFIEYYNGDPTAQYAAIQSVIPQVADHMSQCNFIINTGLAVDKGRNNTYLGALGVEMLQPDKNHIAYGIPDYMCGVLYAMSILGIGINDKINWFPTVEQDSSITTKTSAYLAFLARKCALKTFTEL